MNPAKYCLGLSVALCLAFPIAAQVKNTEHDVRRMGTSAAHVVRDSVLLPILDAKKTIFVRLPLAVGKGAIVLGSAAAGATIGAPVGAIAGAKVGAVYGAIHGVRLANAVIATKQNLLHNSLDVARALIVDPIVMSAGLKVALFAKKATIFGDGVSLLRHGLLRMGGVVNSEAASMGRRIKAMEAAGRARMASAFAAPITPSPKADKGALMSDISKFANTAGSIDSTLTGYRYPEMSFDGLRKKRESQRSQEWQQPISDVVTIIKTRMSRTAQECLAKVICELSSNPYVHGPEGRKFAVTLTAISHANIAHMEYFRSASVTGMLLQNPASCVMSYPQCSTPSSEIVKIGNALING